MKIENLEGNSKFFVYFSNETFNINKDNFDNVVTNNEALIPQVISSELSNVYISRDKNKCYQNVKYMF